MKPTTRKPRQRLNEKLGDYNVRLRAWMQENNASRYAAAHVGRGGELSEEETNRNLEALAAQLADEPDLPVHLAPSYKPHKHAEDERMDDGTPQAPPLELGHLQHQLAALTNRMIELEKLVAASVAYRSLKPSAKAKVDRIDPSVGAAFKDKRTLQALTVYEHVAELPRKKKVTANFPKLLLGEYVDLSVDESVHGVRVIPYTALLHRLAAKKDFRPSLDETSSQENARLAIEKSGLIVTTMHEAGILNGSPLLVVMDRTEAEKRGLVRKGRDAELPKVEPQPQPRAVFDKAAWNDDSPSDLDIEPEPEDIGGAVGDARHEPVVIPPKKGNPRFSGWDEQEDTPTVPDEVLTDTAEVVDEENLTDTTNPVDEEIDDEEWEEEEDDGYNEDPIALFRESGEQQKKSSKAIDLFAD